MQFESGAERRLLRSYFTSERAGGRTGLGLRGLHDAIDLVGVRSGSARVEPILDVDDAVRLELDVRARGTVSRPGRVAAGRRSSAPAVRILRRWPIPAPVRLLLLLMTVLICYPFNTTILTYIKMQNEQILNDHNFSALIALIFSKALIARNMAHRFSLSGYTFTCARPSIRNNSA